MVSQPTLLGSYPLCSFHPTPKSLAASPRPAPYFLPSRISCNGLTRLFPPLSIILSTNSELAVQKRDHGKSPGAPPPHTHTQLLHHTDSDVLHVIQKCMWDHLGCPLTPWNWSQSWLLAVVLGDKEWLFSFSGYPLAPDLSKTL